MKLRHFEAIQPICPLCQKTSGEEHALAIARVLAEDPEGDILEGTLVCGGCGREYPILDGIPLLVPALRAFISQNVFQIMSRDDLSETIESVVGDCCGPGSPVDQVRQYLSSYAWGHYADLDPAESPSAKAPPHVIGILDEGLRLAGGVGEGPILDAGCSVGRTSFALAERHDRLILGVDLSFSMLKLARRVMRTGEARYPRRRVGVVYDRRVFSARFPRTEDVDFWLCDAQALPFRTGTFGLASSLNLLDCVASPYEHLGAIARVLAPGGRAVIASPYDWSSGATPIEAWIGGHSQRGPERGESAAALRALLTPGAHPASIPGIELIGEAEALPWTVRIHDRSTMDYAVHVVAARATRVA